MSGKCLAAERRINTEQQESTDNDSGGFEVSRAARPILGIIVGTAVLYFARDILLPIAMAAILAAVFSPVVSRLEPWVGRILSSALAVTAGIVALAGIFYFLTVELTSVAVEVASYSSNIAVKLSHVEKSTPSWLQDLEDAFHNVENDLEHSNPQKSVPQIVRTTESSSTLEQFAKSAGPILEGIAEALLTLVLLFFFLFSRKDLRDRFVRLSARAGVPVAAQAIEAAGELVSHYLFLISLLNFSFGLVSALVLWRLGIPNPELWGTLGFLLRYIPYIGASVAALMPTLIAFAVFPGWTKAIEVAATFMVLDQICGQVVEPFFIGRGVGVSPIALLFSAAYWAWLWGPAGLIIATPLTACIKVIGDYIPALDFFSLLLGADVASEDHHDYYGKLLELDRQSAQAFAVRYCDEHGLESTFRKIFTPALELAESEFQENHISQASQQFVVDTTRELIAELGNRFSKPRLPARFRVLGVCPPGEVHSLGLLMILELIRQDGITASFAGEHKTMTEILEFVNRYAPNLVYVSSTSQENAKDTVEMVSALKRGVPHLIIVAGGTCALEIASDLLAAGCARVCASETESRRVVRQYAHNRSRASSGESRRTPVVVVSKPPQNGPDKAASE